MMLFLPRPPWSGNWRPTSQKYIKRYANAWRLKNMLLNEQWVIEESKEEI